MSLICKHSTRLEKIAGDKHSSLQRTFVNYLRKKFITLRVGRKIRLIWIVFAVASTCGCVCLLVWMRGCAVASTGVDRARALTEQESKPEPDGPDIWPRPDGLQKTKTKREAE